MQSRAKTSGKKKKKKKKNRTFPKFAQLDFKHVPENKRLTHAQNRTSSRAGSSVLVSKQSHFSAVTGIIWHVTTSPVALFASHFVRLSGEQQPLSAGQSSKLICHFGLFK